MFGLVWKWGISQMANVTIISEENMISQKYFFGNLFVRQTQMQKQVFALRNPSCEWNIKFFFLMKRSGRHGY